MAEAITPLQPREFGMLHRIDTAPAGVDSDPLAPVTNAPTDRPYVIAQLGQSLDGRIATVTGESRWINGEAALTHVHRLRAAVDAVVIGRGTAEADDPLLTVRRVNGRNPDRVVIDPNGCIPPAAKCFNADGSKCFVVQTSNSPHPRAGEPLTLPETEDGRLCPKAIADTLFAAGYRRILIEGGAWTVSRFLEAGALNRLHVLVAPVILGSGKPGVQLPPISKLDRAIRPKTQAFVLDGGDVLFDCDLDA